MELEEGQSMPELSSRVLATDEPIIAVMRAVVAEASHNSSGPPIASLAQGAVWWQPPAVALRAASDAALKSPALSSSYGDDLGLPELRAALLRKGERDHGLKATEHAAVVSAGANLAVSALALALLDSGSSSLSSSSFSSPSSSSKESRTKTERRDAAVLFPPYYFNAKMAVQLAGAEVVLGKSDPETWLPDVGWLEERLREEDDDEDERAKGQENENENGKTSPPLARIRMVYLVNPGNPSGVVVPYELVQRLVEVCSGKQRRSRRAVFLVLDSTYESFSPKLKFSRSSTSTSTSSSAIPPFPLPSAPHVIHVGSFSKAFGAAGWRVGYIIYPLVRKALAPRRRGSGSVGSGSGGGGSGGGGGDGGGEKRNETDDEEAAPSLDLIGPQLLKIQDTLPIHAAIASQRLALACLEGSGGGESETSSNPPPSPSPSPSFGRSWVAEKVAGLASSREAAEAALENLGPGSRVWGEGAIYLWARLPAEGGGGEKGEEKEGKEKPADDREFVRFCVSRHGVAVIPGSACGVPGCVRVAYGKPAPGAEFEEAAARLGRACRAWVEMKKSLSEMKKFHLSEFF